MSSVVPVDYADDDARGGGRGPLVLEDAGGPATDAAPAAAAAAASPSRRRQMLDRMEEKKAAARVQMDLFAQLAEKRKADLMAKKGRAKAALKVKKAELKVLAKQKKAQLKVRKAELKKLAIAKRKRLRELKEQARLELIKVRAMEPGERKEYLAARKARAKELAAKRKAMLRAEMERVKAEKRAQYCFTAVPEPRRHVDPPTGKTVTDAVWGVLDAPLTWFQACAWGDREFIAEAVARTAMEGGADVDDVDGRGMSGLLHACSCASTRNRERAVELLLHLRANVNLQSHPGGSTALMLAAKHGHARVCAALMANGADPLLRDRDGRTAADVARMYRQVKCVYAVEEAIAAPSLLGSAAYQLRRLGYRARYLAEKVHFQMLMITS